MSACGVKGVGGIECEISDVYIFNFNCWPTNDDGTTICFKSFEEYMASSGSTKILHGVGSDLARIEKRFPLLKDRCKGLEELRDHLPAWVIEASESMKLEALVEAGLSKKLLHKSGPQKFDHSRWDSKELSDDQSAYSACDVTAPAELVALPHTRNVNEESVSDETLQAVAEAVGDGDAVAAHAETEGGGHEGADGGADGVAGGCLGEAGTEAENAEGAGPDDFFMSCIKQVRSYAASRRRKPLVVPAGLDRDQRSAVHKVANCLGLCSRSTGRASHNSSDRPIDVTKDKPFQPPRHGVGDSAVGYQVRGKVNGSGDFCDGCVEGFVDGDEPKWSVSYFQETRRRTRAQSSSSLSEVETVRVDLNFDDLNAALRKWQEEYASVAS